MIKKVFTVIVLAIMISVSTIYQVQAGVLDTIRTGYGYISDGGFWRGIAGYVTNTIRYITGQKSEQEYKNWLDGFGIYLTDRQAVADDLIHYDPTTGIVTTTKDFNHYMEEYLNQETGNYGYFKIVKNPALEARAIDYMLEAFEGVGIDRQDVTAFYNNVLNTNEGVRIVEISHTVRTNGDYYNVNVKYSGVLDGDDVAKLYYKLGNTYNTTKENVQGLLYGSGYAGTVEMKAYQPNSSYYYELARSIQSGNNVSFNVGTYSNFTNSFTLCNYTPENMRTSMYECLIVGNGSTNGYLAGSFDTDDLKVPTAPYISPTYMSNDIPEMEIPVNDIINGDHYQMYHDNRQMVSDYWQVDGNVYNDCEINITNVYNTPTPTPTPSDNPSEQETDINFIGLLRNMANQMKQVPAFMADIFNFLPKEFYDVLILIVVVVLAGRILGR